MAALVEYMAIVDAFVSGCGKVEKLRHGNMRVTLFVDQSPDGAAERVVIVKLVGARADLEQIAHAILRADDKPELADTDMAGLSMQ